ncbi:MAG: non-heme iron oxygenase ferredoxin subunit [Gammaproteobacteria bacterium]
MSEWTNVAPASEFGPEQSRLVTVDGVAIAVYNVDGSYYALEDVCTHDGSPILGCGLEPDEVVEGDQIICPRHGARFCIRTGAALTPPAYEPLPCFPVRVQDGMVQTRDNRWD